MINVGSGVNQNRGEPPSLRIGDAEREAAAALLREHYAQGRLSLDELDSRLDACLAARTRRDLDRLLEDLPSMPEPVRRAGRWVAAWRHWASVSVIVWAIWGVGAATGGGDQGLWPLWVSGPWGAALLSRTIRGEDDPIARAKRDARDQRRRLRQARRDARR